MSRLLIFNFDGTGNEPSDAAQDVDYKGAKEDDNISNVLKFHLMLGGDLLPNNSLADCRSNWPDTDQLVFYYHGIGTYGSRLKRLVNAALSLEKSDVAHILDQAMSDFGQYFQPGDTLLVTGFSRGAALGRRFVALVEKYIAQRAEADQRYAGLGSFAVEALYDTVASIGMPNLSSSDRPDSEVVFENGHSLPKIVDQALHCVSLDDKRRAFQPTLMNYQEGVVHEVWFAGAHSDVGGGYYRDRLSDMALEYYLQWIADHVPQARFAMPTEQMLDQVLPPGIKYAIGPDDIARNPSPFGKNHQQDRFFVAEWLTLTDRRCCVIENDKPSDRRPLVHWSVAARINGDGDYRPKSLKNLRHRVVYADGRTAPCTGFMQHINTPRSDLRFLEKPADPASPRREAVTVFSSQYYNYSGLMLEKGATYRFTVEPGQTWKDGNITCGPQGWNRQGVELGPSGIGIALLEPFRRVPEADWFCLCGCIDDDEHAFIIGPGPVEIQVKKSGEFRPFANDKKTHYANNQGKIVVTVQRLS